MVTRSQKRPRAVRATAAELWPLITCLNMCLGDRRNKYLHLNFLSLTRSPASFSHCPNMKREESMQLRINLLRQEQRRERWRVAREGQREKTQQSNHLQQCFQVLNYVQTFLLNLFPFQWHHQSPTHTAILTHLLPLPDSPLCQLHLHNLPQIPLQSISSATSHFLTWLTSAVLAALPPETSFRLNATGLIFLN